MISVPDAGLLPSTPRPVWFMNGSITSSGKPCGYVGNGGRRDDAHELPVAGRRVLALRALEQPAGDRRRAGLRRAALERHHVSEPERLEIGQVEASDGAGDVAEGVRAFVPVLPCVRQLSSADGVEHDDARPRHAGYSTAALDDALGLLLLVVYIVGDRRPRRGDHVRRDQDLPDRAEAEESGQAGVRRTRRRDSDGGGRLFRRSKRAAT